MAKDGSRFRCSDSFVRKFVYEQLRWVPRASTQAAKTVPDDAEQRIWEMFLRLALWIRDSGVRHADLIINWDQTNVVVADNSANTFDVEGSDQVKVIGKGEKRAWTAVVGVSASGAVLPPQIICKGGSERVLPSKSSPGWDEASRLGFVFSFNPKNYWSSFPLMKVYVRDIVVPYFVERRRTLGYPDDQECCALIDCWTVHRGREFLDMMWDEWPWLRIRFVPARCTGLAQPCDVGIQRPYKLSIKRSQLDDVVKEALAHLDAGLSPETLDLDITIGTLRNRSVSWFVKVFHDINKPELVQKVCRLIYDCFNV